MEHGAELTSNDDGAVALGGLGLGVGALDAAVGQARIEMAQDAGQVIAHGGPQPLDGVSRRRRAQETKPHSSGSAVAPSPAVS